MSAYTLLSDVSTISNQAEELAKKLSIHVQRVYYGTNLGRGFVSLYPVLVNNDNDNDETSLIGHASIAKLEQMVISKKYLLTWLAIESKVSPYLILLVASIL